MLLLDSLDEVDGLAWGRIQRVAAEAVRKTSLPPLLVVLSGRSIPALDKWVSPTDPRLFRIEPPVLISKDVSGLLRPGGGSGDPKALEAFADEAVAQGKGLAEAVIERFFAAERSGALHRGGRRWVIGGAAKVASVVPPPRAFQDTLTWLAALSGTAPFDMLLTCVPGGRVEVAAALRWASERGLLRSRNVAGRWYAVLRVAREDGDANLPSLQETHRRIARWLELHGEGGGLCAELRAHHHRMAGDFGAAGAAYRSAAAAHRDVGAPAELRRLGQLSATLEARSTGS